MSVITKLIELLKQIDLTPYLVAIVLSTLLIGFAPSSIALGLLAGYVLIKSVIIKQKINVIYILLLPILFYIYFLLTYFWSIDKDLSIKGMGRMATLLLVPLIFIALPKFTRKSFNLILSFFTKANIILGIVFLSTSLFRYLRDYNLEEFTYHNLVSVLDLNAIYVSAFFSISFFYLMGKSDKTKNDILSLFLIFFIIILLASKSITFILILGICFFLVKNVDIRKIKKKEFIFFLLLGITIISFSSKQIINRVLEEEIAKFNEVLHNEKFGEVYPWRGSSIRLLQLRILKEQIEEDHIFWGGFGLFASRKNLAKRHEDFDTYKAFHLYNYHNTYAQTLSESGLIGFIILLVMLIANFINAVRSKSFLFLMFNILIIIWFFTESVLWVQRGLFFFILFYCLLNRTDFAFQSQ